MNLPTSVLIFTLNEEQHLPACLGSLHWTDDVVVVDSFSSDRTPEICATEGVRFFQRKFEGFGDSRNWALGNIDFRHEWILILDADERVPPDLAHEILEVARSAPPNVSAYRVKRRFYMWGRWLRYSALYPTYVVRLVRRNRVHYINRGHAETQEVSGETRELKQDLIDENVKGIDDWYARQSRYARREAEFELSEPQAPSLSQLLSVDPLARRAAIKGLSANLPLRPVFFFLYCYICRRGFLEGRDGLMFCLMKTAYEIMIVTKKHDAIRSAGSQ